MFRSSREFRVPRGVFVAVASAVVLLSAGCVQRTVSFHEPSGRPAAAGSLGASAAVEAAESPLPEPVAPQDAWWLAEEYVREHRNCEPLVGSGGSMLPLYRDRTVVVVERMEMSRLKAGMTVVFVGDSGRLVAHTLVAATPQGWVAQGLANRERDRTLVRARNYVGTVIKAYTPDPRVPSVRTKASSVATVAPSSGFPTMRTSPERPLSLAPASGN